MQNVCGGSTYSSLATCSKKVDMAAETCHVCSAQSRVLQTSESSDVVEESTVTNEESTVAMDPHPQDVDHHRHTFVSCGQLLQVLGDRFYWMTCGRNLKFLADRFYCLQLLVQITTGGNITQ